MVPIQHIIRGKSNLFLQSKLLGDSQAVQSSLCCHFNLIYRERENCLALLAVFFPPLLCMHTEVSRSSFLSCWSSLIFIRYTYNMRSVQSTHKCISLCRLYCLGSTLTWLWIGDFFCAIPSECQWVHTMKQEESGLQRWALAPCPPSLIKRIWTEAKYIIHQIHFLCRIQSNEKHME